MTQARWAACLASFEEHLTAQFEALEQCAPDRVSAFSPPPGLGPLPAVLAPRARALHARSVALTTAIEDSRERVAAALAQLRRAGEANSPAFLDSRG